METKKIGAGILAIDKQTGDLLLGRRSMQSDNPGTWSPFGGTFEVKDISTKQTAKREFSEETGSISVARDGELRPNLSPEELEKILTKELQ